MVHNDLKLPNESKLIDDEIVISGISGRFPESDNMHELHDNLIKKRDMVTCDDRRWKLDHPRVPKMFGKINNLEKFDTLFFGINPKQAEAMDPQGRMLLEHTYEAIVDAGINPRQLRGTKTGVFIGAYLSESEKKWLYSGHEHGFGFTGCSRAMFANRISYCFDLVGPSFSTDTACSSSLTAFEQAYRAIKDGCCEAAIVGGSNLCLEPYVAMQLFNLGALPANSPCKTWDQSAEGYARSEAVCVTFLQKAKDAKRVYARVVHSKINCDGYTDEGLNFPSKQRQIELCRDVYNECGVSPLEVEYVEAHGTGTRAGDPAEIAAIDEAFTRNGERNAPLLIGSVKSNLGHSEAASGLVSIAKVILSMESGVIPANLHFKQCNENLTAILEGRLKVITEPTAWRGEYAVVNSFGIGGANAHVLLKRNPKEKINNGLPNDDLPRLIVVSGRNEDAVAGMLDTLESKPIDIEQLALVYNIQADEIVGHLYRGYSILRSSPNTPLSKCCAREIVASPGYRRPVCFVFSGMGSQWPGMGEALLRLPVFAKAIDKCDSVLRAHNIDIYHVLTDRSALGVVLNCFVGIAAVQIGLVDVLYSLGIKADQLIGHSVGELGCAYADGCLTAEQMIMSAYYRGLVSTQTTLVNGSMAAVGLGHEEMKILCPPDVEVACHNSSSSSTISGPAKSITKLVTELKANNIFAKEVACGSIAFHSSYIAAAGPNLSAHLKNLIPDAKLRSSKWLSTSVPMDMWNSELGLYSSAEYYTNNLLNPVLFEETSALIPQDAIVIEIAPHGLLQAVLKRSLATSITNISLTQRDSEDSLDILLQAIGKMFNNGLHPQVDNLYPAVSFPVSRSTPMISPMIKWEHKDDWFVNYFKSHEGSAERLVKINVKSLEFKTMADHVLNGRNLIPATGYLTLVWETFGMMKGTPYDALPVVFEDVRFLRATTLPKEGEVELTVIIQKGTGRFEIVDGDTAVVTGIIRSTVDSEDIHRKWISSSSENMEDEYMTSRDVYQEFKFRGYQYTGKFRSITKATEDGLRARVAWHDDWIAFMDCMIQLAILAIDARELFVPVSIKKITIDPKLHCAQIKSGKSLEEFNASYDKLHKVISSNGIQIFGLQALSIARRKLTHEPILQEYKFVPFADEAEMNPWDLAKLITSIVMENHTGVKMRTVELLDNTNEVSSDNSFSHWISKSLENMSYIEAEVTILRADSSSSSNDNLTTSAVIRDLKTAYIDTKALLVVGRSLLTNDRSDHLNLVLQELKIGGFVLTRENTSFDIETAARAKGFHVVLKKRYDNEIFALLRKKKVIDGELLIINVHNDKFNWIESMRETMKTVLEKENARDSRILFVGQDNFDNGLLGFINCLRREPGGEIIRGILIQDPSAPIFSTKNPFYSKQLEQDLVACVLRENGCWGNYIQLPLAPVETRMVYHSFLKQNVRGDLSSLTWTEGPLRESQVHENLVKIVYASMNFKDIMLATGKLPLSSTSTAETRQNEEVALGIEYSGIDNSGKRIMGMIGSRALGNLCLADPALSWEVPENWSLEDAATVPCVYATCCYAMYLKGNMRKGDKVLIHAGTGGIGQAAINLALAEGCEVFVTVGTAEKRRFIKNNFPQIQDNHIGNSRDTSFVSMIREQTNGYGVDLVLNSLSEEKLLASVDCLAWGGRFLEIGKFDLTANNPLGMECFLREVSFHGVVLDHLFTSDERKKLETKAIVEKLLKSGAIKPLVRTVFLKDEVETVFRLMAAGKHIGKVLIKMQDENSLDSMQISAPQYYCLENRSYIILGGLGGFGLELCDWLVMRGAKNLVITSRTGLRTGYQKMRVSLWRKYGVNVIIVSHRDASVYDDCKFIIEIAEKLAPVDGIFNLAAVLKDALWENQTADYFEESFKPKAWTTKNLDSISRKLCSKLRHFVVFSSFFSCQGNAGQSNYGMSNSVMERICETRAAEGLPALAVQWGPVGDVGLLADAQENNEDLGFAGFLWQSIVSCLDKLNDFLLQSRPIVSSIIVAEKKTANSLSILSSVLDIMGLKDLNGVNLRSTLPELGMDSMMTVELKQTFEREFDIFLSAHDIRNLTLGKIKEMSDARTLNEKSKGLKE